MTKKDKKTPKTEDLAQELGEYKLHLQRLQADFENYIKRADQEKAKYKEFIESQTISKFLNTIDDLERTLESIDNKQTKRAIEIIYQNLNKTLESFNVKPFNSLNQEPDPNKHHVLETVEGEKDNIIVQELQKGYTIGDKILRPALVKVSTHTEEKQNE